MPEDGVMPQSDAINAMWQNQKDRLELAKNQAMVARKRGDYASAHSIMLSAYITLLSGNPVEGRSVKFFILALRHAFCMWRHQDELDHNKLDVWLSFILKLRAKMPVLKSILDKTLSHAAKKEVIYAACYGKPHQVALAYMTYAQVVSVVDRYKISRIETNIQIALNQEEAIRAETDQPQGLRQFVRVLRKAGELNLAIGNRDIAMKLFERALELAEGEADAPDQVPKIEAFLPSDPN